MFINGCGKGKLSEGFACAREWVKGVMKGGGRRILLSLTSLHQPFHKDNGCSFMDVVKEDLAKGWHVEGNGCKE